MFDRMERVALTERAALLVLLREGGSSWSAVADEVEAAGSALQVLDSKGIGQQALFSEDAPLEAVVAAAEEEIRGWEAEGLRFLTLLDTSFPGHLLTIHQRPPFLMARGHLEPSDAAGVAVVGTRKASDRGLDQARELAAGLANRRVPVISGLAAGIDTAAHIAALEAGGRTVAVIGTGIRRAYPKENAELQQRIATEGLVLSQFLPDAPPTKNSFPMRNAVMSGYAAATVVVEASWQSGARMQARLALQHGRAVILLETLMQHDWARQYAQRPNTIVASRISDVLEALERVTLASRDELVWA
jgi:DNA processing protein